MHGIQGNGAFFREEAASNQQLLAHRRLEVSMEISQQVNASSAQRLNMLEPEPSMAPPLGQPCIDIPGLKWYCPL